MKRADAIEEIMKIIRDWDIVVSNLGHPSQELYKIKHREGNFYMLGSMGLASSIGIGISLAIERSLKEGKKQRGKKRRESMVVVIDGDGSILMNFGTLATLGVVRPRRLVLAVLDNKSYGSTGFQKTYTCMGLDISEVAKACGIEKTYKLKEKSGLRKVLRKSLNELNGPYCIVVEVEKGLREELPPIPLKPRIIKKNIKNFIRRWIL